MSSPFASNEFAAKALDQVVKLPESTFAVYEAPTVHGFVCKALSRYSYPLLDPTPITSPENLRMTVLEDGQSITTRRPALYFGPPTKQVRLENVGGKLRYNGHRMPFGLAKIAFNGLGIK